MTEPPARVASPSTSSGDDSGEELLAARDLERRFGLFGAAAGSDAHELAPGARGSVSCGCARCAAWSRFIQHGALSGAKQYEVFTRELVSGLARALVALRAALQPAGRALRVLELGAGDGRLARHIRRELARRGPGPEGVLVVASDAAEPGARSRPAASAAPECPVLVADYRAALARCAPDVVLVCWMPLGHDWTGAIRASPSVRAYLLVGDASGALCGEPSGTWGISERGAAGGARAALPARAHGWHVRELEALSEAQLCMADEPWSNVRHSRTVLVAREEGVLAAAR